MTGVFERFTIEARQVVAEASEHAHRLGHHWIGCEHLLLGVAGSDTPVAALFHDRSASPHALEQSIGAVTRTDPGDSDDAVLLATLGVDLAEVRRAAEAVFGTDALEAAATRRRTRLHFGRRRRCGPPASSGKATLTPKAKRCLERSLRESLRLEHGHIGVDHIALALLSRDDTAAWQVLVHLGVNPTELSQAIEESQRRVA